MNAFEFRQPDTVEEALTLMHDLGEDARVMAGGHSAGDHDEATAGDARLPHQLTETQRLGSDPGDRMARSSSEL